MGLDIYLTPVAQHEANEANEAAWEAIWERKERGEIDQATYDRLNKELRDAPSTLTEEQQADAKADVRSPINPEHINTRRYLRSSYNGGGFNRAVPQFLGRKDTTYYDIFAPLERQWDGDKQGPFDETTIPAWNECKKRALEIAEELRTCDGLSVTSFDAVPMIGDKDHMWHEPPSETDALNAARELLNTRVDDKGFDSFSNAKGDFFTKGMTIFAAIPGVDVLGRPAVHVIYRPTPEGDEPVTHFYVQAAEIVAELCDEAIRLIERDGKVYFAWSG